LPRAGLAISTGYGKEPGKVSWCGDRAGPRHGTLTSELSPGLFGGITQQAGAAAASVLQMLLIYWEATLRGTNNAG
jgi:hypothetical protein